MFWHSSAEAALLHCGEARAPHQTAGSSLEAVEATSPYLEASWERLVEELSGLTLDLETPDQGRLLMVLESTTKARAVTFS